MRAVRIKHTGDICVLSEETPLGIYKILYKVLDKTQVTGDAMLIYGYYRIIISVPKEWCEEIDEIGRVIDG